MENSHLSDVVFSSLGLHETLLKALNDAGFDHCTPIQAQTLPVALAGKDVAGQAQTGTGKTAAFLLATLHYLMSNPVSPKREGPWALILAPTRELAIQIHKDAVQLGKYTGMYFSAVYGGTGYESQRKELETGTDIIIGTPGRVIDFFKQGVFHLKDIEVMILDEADRMFDLGFIDDIRYLLRRMPPPEKRINMLYSATLSHRVMELAYEHMNEPTVIKVEAEQVTADRVQQRLYHVANDEKIPLLIGLVKQEHLSRTIVFVNTKRGAELVHRYLEGNGFQAAVLSGDIPQRKREQLLGQFQAGELSILVATDVAARGLHIPDVSHVINFDLPDNAEDYVHRIGRTARAGASGDAISFACESYVYSLPEIEAYIEQKIPSEPTPRELLVTPEPPAPAPPRKPRSGGPRRGAPRGRDNRQRSSR